MIQARVLWVFADFEVDPMTGSVWRGGSRVDIDAKPLGVLAELIRRRDRVVSRDELREAVWPGVTVSDAAIASALRDLRRVLDDTGSRQRFVRTVRSRGFRFVAEVEERRLPPPADVFVGREEVLSRMESTLSEVGPAGGRWLWLAGEPGIGKTRALLELMARLGRRGFEVYFGSCLEEPGAAPYRPWQQIIRRIAGSATSRELADRFGPLAAESLRLLPEANRREAGVASHAAESDERLLLFDAVTELLRGAAVSGPIVAVIEDLHRADAPTAKLAQHLIRELPHVPVMVVATYRPHEVGANDPVASALAESQPGVERLTLRGLPTDDVRRLAEAVVGRPVSPEVCDEVVRRTQGNPFFVREIAQTIGEEGLADPRSIDSLMPLGVTQVVQGRVRRLRPSSAEALECAAVIGRVFDLDVLRTVLVEDGASEATIDPLDDALAAGFLEPVSDVPGRLRFSHILVRDAVYSLAPSARRTALHARVGQALERLRADSDTDLAASLSYHFGEAAAQGHAEPALRYALRAGDDALTCSAWEEAERFFGLALRALDVGDSSGDGRARAASLVGLGRARWRGGAPDSAREAFEQAARLAEREGDADTLADAALGYAGRTDAEPSVNRKSVSLLERAISALPETDSSRRCEVIARLGTEFYHGDIERCDALTQRALAIAERLGDRDILAYALSARAFALLRPDVEPMRRVALYDRQLTLVDAASELAALGWQEKIVAWLEQGDRLRVDDAMRIFRGLVQNLRQPFFRWMLGIFDGARLFLSGRVDDAVRLAEENFALGLEFGTPNALPAFSVQLSYLRREQGRMAELESAMREMLAGESAYPALRSGLPPMLLERGRRQEARDVFEEILARNLDEVPRDQHWLPSLALLASACAELRDAKRARVLYEFLAACAGRMVVVGHGAICDGAVDHHLGRLAACMDAPELADEHFAAAVELERRAGARLYVAHSQRHWAAVLWKSGAPHERQQARDLVTESTETYRALGLDVPRSEVPVP